MTLLGVVLIFSVACSSKKKEQNEQAAIYFGAGTQSLLQQEYTDALSNLLKANQLDPDNSEILNNLGMAYYFKGEKDLALKSLKKSLSINKDNSDARLNLASIYFKDGDFTSAEKIYKEVLKDLTYEKQARTYYNLGVLELQHRKNVSAAEKYFRKSLKENDSYCPSYYQLGMIQYSRRQFNTALKNFKEAGMGVCYDSASAHYYQGLTYVKLNRFNEARMKFDEIDTRFKKSVFAVKARSKMIELNEIERNYMANENHASGKMLDKSGF